MNIQIWWDQIIHGGGDIRCLPAMADHRSGFTDIQGNTGRAGALPVIYSQIIGLLVLQAGDAGQVVGTGETTAVLTRRLKT